MVLASPGAGEGPRLFLCPRDLAHLKLLEGESWPVALSRLGSLFQICRVAQDRLARLALRAARRDVVPEAGGGEWDILKESLLETIRSLFLPSAGGASLFSASPETWQRIRDLGSHPPDLSPRFFSRFREVAEGHVLGESPSRFLARETEREWEAWIAEAGRLSPVARHAALLAGESGGPDVFAKDLVTSGPGIMEGLARSMEERDFLRFPHQEGEGRETGPFSRMRRHPLVASLVFAGRPLAARLAARLAEIAFWALEGKDFTARSSLFGIGALSLGEAGLAWAETARGLLVHRWTLRGDRVAKVRILAPTEWTFAPEGGPFSRWFAACFRDTPEDLLGRALWIFDPCAPVSLRVTGSGRGKEGAGA